MRYSKLFNITLFITLALLVVGWLVASTRDTSLEYYKTVEELLHERAQFQNRTVRVNGHLKTNSIQRRTGTNEYRFTLEKNGVDLPVTYSGILPDTLTTASEIIVEGVLHPTEDLFHGTEILTKCPSKYEAEADRKERPASRTN